MAFLETRLNPGMRDIEILEIAGGRRPPTALRLHTDTPKGHITMISVSFKYTNIIRPHPQF